jgi:hypothetical protein
MGAWMLGGAGGEGAVDIVSVSPRSSGANKVALPVVRGAKKSNKEKPSSGGGYS